MPAGPIRSDEPVSVILPYHNRRDSLRRAAQSVLGQTHANLILYLIDDGSTDGSFEAVSDLEDTRIVHVRLSENCGVSGARNSGLERVQTRLVAFMDSDDEWLRSKLERQMAALRDLDGKDISVVGCGWRQEGKPSPTKSFDSGPFTRSDVFRDRVAGIGTPMLLIDTAVAAATPRFDNEMPALEDKDYVLTCTSNGSRVAVVPEVLAVVTRRRPDHAARPGHATSAWERYIVKYAPELKADAELSSWYHYRACREHLVARDLSSSASHMFPALRRDPVRRGIQLALGAVGGSRGMAVARKLGVPSPRRP